jgi:hypothetical protein
MIILVYNFKISFMKKFLCVVFAYVLHGIFTSQAAQKTLPCYDLTEVLRVEPTFLYKPHLDASKSFGVKF